MNESNPGPKRTRLESEIDEILAKSNKPIPITAKARSRGRNVRSQIRSLRSRTSWIGWFDSTWGWFAIALIVFFAGGALTDNSGLAWQLIRYAGLAAFVMGVVRLFKPARPVATRHKIWRGRVVDMKKPGVELGDKFDEWRRRR